MNGESPKDFFEKYIYQLPNVCIQNSSPSLACTCIKSDNFNFSYQAVEHLYNLGHRNIGFITSCFSKTTTKELYYGYLLAMDMLGLPVHQESLLVWQREKVNGVIPMEYTLPDLSDILGKALSADEKPTAFICLDWFYAKAVIESLKKFGKQVPQDISVICRCNDTNKNMETGITGLNSRLSDICSIAAKLLLEIIDNRSSSKNSTILVRPEFIHGNTTMPRQGQ